MSTALTAAAFVAGAYLLGSVPFALLVGRGIYHVDVRQSGSGNIGTTNVFRVLGKKAGVAVFIGDAAKGFIPVYLALQLAPAGSEALIAVLAGGAAIAGHTWSIFLKGKGGKGVATGGGAILALVPLVFLAVFAIFWLVLLVGRTVSVASLTAAASFSIAVLATHQPLPYIVFALVGTAVVFYAHRANIGRLARGQENRVTFPWNRKDDRGAAAKAAPPSRGSGGDGPS